MNLVSCRSTLAVWAILVGSAGLLGPSRVAASSPNQQPAEGIEAYDHSTNLNWATSMTAKDGQKLKLQVKNTCKSYEAKVEPIPGNAVARVEAALSNGDCDAEGQLEAWRKEIASFVGKSLCEPQDKLVEWTHEKKYRAYKIVLAAPEGQPVTRFKDAADHDKYKNGGAEPEVAKKACQYAAPKTDAGTAIRKALIEEKKVMDLRPVELSVFVTTEEWEVQFAGGFTAGWATDPQYAIETFKVKDAAGNETDARYVVEDEEAQDDVRLGVGAFITAFRTSGLLAHVAPTFGIGINNGNNATYYAGLSLRASDRAHLTAGWQWTPVSRLPNGVSAIAGTEPAPGDQPVDASFNLPSPLPTRTQGGFFLAFSFSFLGSDARKSFEERMKTIVPVEKKEDK